MKTDESHETSHETTDEISHETSHRQVSELARVLVSSSHGRAAPSGGASDAEEIERGYAFERPIWAQVAGHMRASVKGICEGHGDATCTRARAWRAGDLWCGDGEVAFRHFARVQAAPHTDYG